MKKMMKSGKLPFLLDFSRIARISTIGIIQSVRVSFKMVATCRAASLCIAAAPTTEEVSWIESAAQVPNCSALKGMT